jgi:predicted nuclease of predicted toxin-antitoxin system
MLRLLTDENFNANIVRGLTLSLPDLDIVAVKHVGLSGSPDPVLLRWAAQQDRAMLTHDIKTMVPDAHELLRRSEPMAGVILVPGSLAVGRAVRDLELLFKNRSQSGLCNRVEYLPLQALQ